MLKVEDIRCGYGLALALFGVNLEVNKGEVVALMGRNGMGKSTTIRSIIGLNKLQSGSISFDGKEISNLHSYQIARLGIGIVPEGREIFPTLSVLENLMVVASNHSQRDKRYAVEDIFTIFPKLKTLQKRLGGNLSGGEQQMLAIGRALMTNPSLLLLDEATEGLAPLICEEIWHGLSILKSRGLAILVVDKDVDALMKISERTYILEKGEVVWHGKSDAKTLTQDIRMRYIGV